MEVRDDAEMIFFNLYGKFLDRPLNKNSALLFKEVRLRPEGLHLRKNDKLWQENYQVFCLG
jgi:hypothetical protein